jgi:chromate transport protein ChrA
VCADTAQRVLRYAHVYATASVGAGSSVSRCSLYTEESRRELRGALAVFISVMLSSALLISIRAALSLAFSGSAEVSKGLPLHCTSLRG